jgi:hypothetical protein
MLIPAGKVLDWLKARDPCYSPSASILGFS